ncbi:MAG: phage protein Gp27 family protein [Tistlia sp.]|uniref:phage protein Gp27 family protein n=1 Tax=Tistlia sp. TaxID=3057121 RepID=UPI0034A33748
MPQKSKIETELAPADLTEFQRMLATGRLSIDGLVLWLEGRGYEISRSSVGRYAQSFEEVSKRLRESRQVTDALVAELGDAAAQGKQGRLLVEMTRTLVFDLLMKLQSGQQEMDAAAVMKLGKGLAELARALRLDQDFELKLREQLVEEIVKKAIEAAQRGAAKAGVTLGKDALEQIRGELGLIR